MAYDEDLAERIRTALHRRRGVTEMKMFGAADDDLRAWIDRRKTRGPAR